MPHIHDLIDFTVTGYIVHDEKVLLILHKKLELWLPPGGHIDLDEDPDQAVLREVKEETGLDVNIHGTKFDRLSDRTKPLHTPAFMDIHKISDTHQHIGMHYICTPKNNSNKANMNKEEVSDMRWFTRTEIENTNDLMLEVKQYALKALDKIS